MSNAPRVPCPHCGAEEERVLVDSVNAPRQPELVHAILAGRLHVFRCGACDREFLVDRPLVYIDLEAGHWIHVFSRADERSWETREAEADHFFERATSGHPVLREQAASFAQRTVFGLGALREKVVALRAGLDDTALEALKLDMLRRTESFSWRRDAPVRLVSVEDAGLAFEQAGSDDVVTVPRAWLDVIAAAPEWAAAREAVAAGSYVDIARTAGHVHHDLGG
ncbi:MAG: hypothetical protein EP329_00425 [Deltaproteobacteria bacterium]|nr:MAG: hypothetical protein EP329_00425 [Deltaproteobacteria bacterium]